jgi:hypothetical protein
MTQRPTYRGDGSALPRTVDELVEMLDTRSFPLRSFPVTADLVEIHRHLGARDVVDLLRNLQQRRDDKDELLPTLSIFRNGKE